MEAQPSRASTAIHMWGVFISLGVVWVSPEGVVVDTRLARPWRAYVPRAAAQYVLEGRPSMLESVAVGDQLEFVDATQDLEPGA